MKLRNKKTKEIAETFHDDIVINSNKVNVFQSLAELNSEWEDYEEPKEYWYIDDAGVIQIDKVLSSEINMRKSIGNYFETKEEAEKAVEKLKAWKRLKDKKFEFTEWYKSDGCEPFIVVETNIDYDDVDNKELQKDLDLLFGGEE